MCFGRGGEHSITYKESVVTKKGHKTANTSNMGIPNLVQIIKTRESHQFRQAKSRKIPATK